MQSSGWERATIVSHVKVYVSTFVNEREGWARVGGVGEGVGPGEGEDEGEEESVVQHVGRCRPQF